MATNEIKPAIALVDTPVLPDPKYWAHAVSIDQSSRLVFTSGITGQTTEDAYPETFSEQVKVAFANLEAALLAAGSSMRDVVKITFLPVDWSIEAKARDMFEPFVLAMTEKYGFQNRPLTTTIPVAALGDPRALFEVEAVAALPGRGHPFVCDAMLPIDRSPPPRVVDVVIIGGGFSGCMAAYDLQKAGVDCVLLEAKHRVGGRSWTQKLRSGPGVIEMGATWINKTTQPKIYALTQEFGLECVEQWEKGDSIMQMPDGSVLRIKDGDMAASEDPELLQGFGTLLAAVESADSQFTLANPEDAAAELDISVEQWIREKSDDSPVMDGIGRHLVAALVGREPHEVGIHFILDYLRSCGGIVAVGGEGEFGAQSLKIRTGTSSIATSLAGSLKPGSVLLNTPVDTVIQPSAVSTDESHPVLIQTANGTSFKCRKAILAIPSNTYDYISFSPALPPAKRAIVSKTMGGIYCKAVVSYRNAWWRDIGLSGKFSSLVGPICFSWEIADPVMEQYSLAFFVSGPWATEWQNMDRLSQEESIIEHLATLVGAEYAHMARDVLEFNAKAWYHEDFIRGAPISSMAPGDLRKYAKALREPIANIHIAGGETAYEWKGFLEGALLSGSRAAEEVITAIGGKK